MGERLLCKQEVVGSSPITSTTCGPLVGAAGAEAAGDRRPGAGSRFVVWHRGEGLCEPCGRRHRMGGAVLPRGLTSADRMRPIVCGACPCA